MGTSLGFDLGIWFFFLVALTILTSNWKTSVSRGDTVLYHHPSPTKCRNFNLGNGNQSSPPKDLQYKPNFSFTNKTIFFYLLSEGHKKKIIE